MKKVGAFCWLSLAICIVELLICIKFGHGTLVNINHLEALFIKHLLLYSDEFVLDFHQDYILILCLYGWSFSGHLLEWSS